MGGSKDDTIHALAPEHLNILFFDRKVIMGGAKDDVISQSPDCGFDTLSQFCIEGVGDRGDDEAQCLGSFHHQTSGDEIGSVV